MSSAAAQHRTQRIAALNKVPREVYDLMRESEGPVVAYELLRRLQLKRGRNVPPPTIYRAVDALMEAGLAHKIEELGAYVLCGAEEDHAHDPAFVVCERCEHVFEISAGAMRSSIEKTLEQAGFHMHRMSSVVHGLCAQCQKDAHVS
jgi:Fur family zinc uptake transcriptional regulator